MTIRGTLSAELIVGTAVAYVDKHGIESLTLRKLGDELGCHFTAIYRHFRSREELLSAMFDFVISDIGAGLAKVPDDPRLRIRAIALSFRRALHQHPALVGTIVSTRGTEATFDIQRMIAKDMAALGVARKDIAAKYQALESYVFGSAMFDYLSAPNHLEHRLNRFSRIHDGIFDRVGASAQEIDEHNEKAFAYGLDAILDSFTN